MGTCIGRHRTLALNRTALPLQPRQAMPQQLLLLALLAALLAPTGSQSRPGSLLLTALFSASGLRQCLESAAAEHHGVGVVFPESADFYAEASRSVDYVGWAQPAP